MDLLRESDIDLAPLEGKRVAILGFGNQGHAQALNLRDTGIDVLVGLRPASNSIERAKASGVRVALVQEAVASADLVMFLAPDETLGGIYAEVEALLKGGAAIGFSHGLAIHFGFIQPRDDLDVILVAPKGPGSALRSLYQAGQGMVALWAVAQEASGGATKLALAYGAAIGCARAGLIASTFAEECEADLFNEQAIVWGGVPELLMAGFETLTAAGISPQVAFLECVGELKLIADLIDRRGIAGMREAISNTAELGALLAGPRIIDEHVRNRLTEVLADIRSGAFADQLRAESASNYARLKMSRMQARNHQVERVFQEFKGVAASSRSAREAP